MYVLPDIASGRTKSSPSDNFYSFNPVVVFKSVFVGSEISHSVLCANSFLLGAKSLVYFFSLSIRYYDVVCKSDFVLGVISPLQSRRVQICFIGSEISHSIPLCVVRFCSRSDISHSIPLCANPFFVRSEISHSIPLLCANPFLLGEKSPVYFFSLSMRPSVLLICI